VLNIYQEEWVPKNSQQYYPLRQSIKKSTKYISMRILSRCKVTNIKVIGY